MLSEDGVPVEAANRGHHARNRTRRQSFVHETVDEMFEVVPVELLKRFFRAGREFSKPLEIAAVTFKCVIGKAPFDTQMCQICVDKIMRG
jgi:hypothetical protein